ncbi:MAG: hypothetical protein LBS21_01280 [Clostridiales bacterium]|nr:hypothetical protein [Clostridiales bacterium]
MIVTVFEMIISIARNYVFAHTAGKIDVILGSKLFNHLVHLPLAYFENRRCGDTVSRVRELENIRRFLTGTPLTTILEIPLHRFTRARRSFMKTGFCRGMNMIATRRI